MPRSKDLLIVRLIILSRRHIKVDSTIIGHQGENSGQIFELICHCGGRGQGVNLLSTGGVRLVELRCVLETGGIADIWLARLIKEFKESKLSKSLTGCRSDLEGVLIGIIRDTHSFWVKLETKGAGNIVTNISRDIWEQFGRTQNHNLIKVLELCASNFLGDIVGEVSTLDPKVESFFAVSEFPESV